MPISNVRTEQTYYQYTLIGYLNTTQLDDSSPSFAHSAKIQQKNSKYLGKYLDINLLYPPK